MAKLRVKERLVVKDEFSEEDVEAAIICCHRTDYYVLFNYMKEDDVEPLSSRRRNLLFPRLNESAERGPTGMDKFIRAYYGCVVC